MEQENTWEKQCVTILAEFDFSAMFPDVSSLRPQRFTGFLGTNVESQKGFWQEPYGTVVRFDFSIFSGVAIQKVAQVDALGFTLGNFPSFIPQTSCNKWIDWMLLGSFGFTSGAFFSYSPILLIMVISLFLILLIMGGMLVIDEPLILCWYSFLLFMLNYIPYDSPWLQNMLGLQKLWCPWWLYPQQWWCTHWELQGIVWGFQSQGTPKTWVSTINWSNDLDDLG